ncbi:hypothetical protein ACQP3L_39880, partial [Escherichia coli]
AASIVFADPLISESVMIPRIWYTRSKGPTSHMGKPELYIRKAGKVSPEDDKEKERPLTEPTGLHRNSIWGSRGRERF